MILFLLFFPGYFFLFIVNNFLSFFAVHLFQVGDLFLLVAGLAKQQARKQTSQPASKSLWFSNKKNLPDEREAHLFIVVFLIQASRNRFACHRVYE